MRRAHYAPAETRRAIQHALSDRSYVRECRAAGVAPGSPAVDRNPKLRELRLRRMATILAAFPGGAVVRSKPSTSTTTPPADVQKYWRLCRERGIPAEPVNVHGTIFHPPIAR